MTTPNSLPQEQSGNIALAPVIDPQLLQQGMDWVRTMSQPSINEVAQKVGARREPAYGYWEPYAQALGKDDAAAIAAIRAEHEPASRAKPAEERNGFDLFLLGTSRDVPADVRAPEGTHLTPAGYYTTTGQRVAEALEDGQLPEGFEDPAVLEKTTALLVARGLSALSGQPDRRNSDLDAALTIMPLATQRVPGFNPVKARLHVLYDRSISYAGILQADSRKNLTDGGRSSARGALHAAEQTIAALFIQGRDNLLTPETSQ